MRKILFLSALVMAGLFAMPAQQAKADHVGVGLSFGINIAPGYYGYYGRGYDYCPPSYNYYYYRPYTYRPYYYGYPSYRSYYYYGGPSIQFRYYDRDGYRGYRSYDRYYGRHHR